MLHSPPDCQSEGFLLQAAPPGGLPLTAGPLLAEPDRKIKVVRLLSESQQVLIGQSDQATTLAISENFTVFNCEILVDWRTPILSVGRVEVCLKSSLDGAAMCVAGTDLGMGCDESIRCFAI